MRRGSIVQLVLLGVLFGAVATAVAIFIPWLPPVASREARRIDIVIWLATAICIAVFSLVAAALVYSLIHFRARPDDDSDGKPIHGHTGLEIVWTLIPTILVTVIAIVSSIVLVKNGEAGPDPLRVDVISQQFAWKFTYQGTTITSPVLYLPRGRSVKLDIRALDVIHSFWVPEFGQKQDAVPGTVQHLVITPTKDGTYPVICTELCGLGHATMRSTAVVMEPDAFAAWEKSQAQPPAAGGGGQAGGTDGKTIFNGKGGCNSCHTLTAAGATGQIGPNLDKLAEEAQRAGQPLDVFVRESIVNPGAYVEHGFPNGVMPPDFEKTLSGAELDALVQYLVQSSKGS